MGGRWDRIDDVGWRNMSGIEIWINMWLNGSIDRYERNRRKELGRVGNLRRREEEFMGEKVDIMVNMLERMIGESERGSGRKVDCRVFEEFNKGIVNELSVDVKRRNGGMVREWGEEGIGNIW